MVMMVEIFNLLAKTTTDTLIQPHNKILPLEMPSILKDDKLLQSLTKPLTPVKL